MSSLFEGRGSDSPYIEAVWRGRAGSDYAPVCPASGHWHLLFLRQNGRVKVSVEGPLTKATPVTQAEGTGWFGVTFPLGTFLPSVYHAFAVIEVSFQCFSLTCSRKRCAQRSSCCHW